MKCSLTSSGESSVGGFDPLVGVAPKAVRQPCVRSEIVEAALT